MHARIKWAPVTATTSLHPAKPLVSRLALHNAVIAVNDSRSSIPWLPLGVRDTLGLVLVTAQQKAHRYADRRCPPILSHR